MKCAHLRVRPAQRLPEGCTVCEDCGAVMRPRSGDRDASEPARRVVLDVSWYADVPGPPCDQGSIHVLEDGTLTVLPDTDGEYALSGDVPPDRALDLARAIAAAQGFELEKSPRTWTFQRYWKVITGGHGLSAADVVRMYNLRGTRRDMADWLSISEAAYSVASAKPVPKEWDSLRELALTDLANAVFDVWEDEARKPDRKEKPKC